MNPVILNHSDAHTPPTAGSVVDIAPELKHKMDQFKADFFDMEKGGVDYGALKDSKAFAEYSVTSTALRHFDLDRLATRESKLAFWINIYNALVVHGIVALDIRESVKEISSFFGTVSYTIGGHVFSLDDIEHGILRCNKKKHLLSPKPFRGRDPRTGFMVHPFDPRIHFALVCGSSSCPPIDVYEEERIDEQLDLVSDAFVNSEEVSLDMDRSRIEVSRIFKWYGKDFGGKKGILNFITRYRYKQEEKDFLKTTAHALKIGYLPYNWSLNAAK